MKTDKMNKLQDARILLDLIMDEYGLEIKNLLAIGIEQVMAVKFHETGMEAHLLKQLTDYQANIDLDGLDYDKLAESLLY